MNNDLYVQYGCGMSAPEGWRNFDCSPTLRFERLPVIGKLYTKNQFRFSENIEFGDIVKGLPIRPDSCAAVYCSHVLEHLSLEDFRKALKNTYLILKSDGIFRLVLPDLEHFTREFLNNSGYDAAINFMRGTHLGQERRERNLRGFITSWLGNTKHLWMWDFKSIEHELKAAGFIKIRRAQFGDSSEPMFNKVEDKLRWKNCLGVECKKLK